LRGKDLAKIYPAPWSSVKIKETNMNKIKTILKIINEAQGAQFLAKIFTLKNLII